MNGHRLWAVARKETIQVCRDSRSLMIVLAMPVVLMLLFGYGVNLDLRQQPICVWDREGSQASQDLLRHFAASQYFHVVRAASNYGEITHALDSGEAKMALVVPWNFSPRLAAGETVGLQAIVDASDDNTANVLIGYAQSVLQSYTTQLTLERLTRLGQPAPPPPLTIALRTWFNEELESRNFIVPGVLSLVMSVIGAFLTALTIAREWERGTMEQLISTPVTAAELMLGKLIPYFAVGMVAALVCAALGVFWFHVPFRGSLLALLISTALFLISMLTLGFLISVVTRNQLLASQIALLATFLPAFLLSGFLFSIDQMPQVVQWFTRIVPARYYTSLLKAIFLKGTPLLALAQDLLPLAAIATMLSLLATHAFRKRLD